MQNSLGTIVENAIGQESKSVLFFHANTLFDLLLPRTHQYYHASNPKYPVGSTFLKSKSVSQSGITLHLGIINNLTQETSKFAATLDTLQAPSLLIQHNISTNDNPKTLKYTLERSGRIDRIVFTSEYTKKFWGVDGEVLQYGFVEQEKTEKDIELLIVGNMGENSHLLSSILKRNKSAVSIGINGGLTKPYKSLKDLTSLMKRAKFTMALTPDIEPPLFAMLAMSCSSCPIVNKTKLSSELIQNEKNGFLITDVNEISVIAKSTSNGRVHDMQERAVETILTNYPRQAFEDKFSELVDGVSKEIYIR